MAPHEERLTDDSSQRFSDSKGERRPRRRHVRARLLRHRRHPPAPRTDTGHARFSRAPVYGSRHDVVHSVGAVRWRRQSVSRGVVLHHREPRLRCHVHGASGGRTEKPKNEAERRRARRGESREATAVRDEGRTACRDGRGSDQHGVADYRLQQRRVATSECTECGRRSPRDVGLARIGRDGGRRRFWRRAPDDAGPVSRDARSPNRREANATRGID